jgi:hypothetical protein
VLFTHMRVGAVGGSRFRGKLATRRKFDGAASMFSRQYRAALLDYLLGSGESGRERAYELGRCAIGSSLGLLQILRVHQQALSAIFVFESASSPGEGRRRLKASQEFLMEALSPFDMACRGYSDMVGAPARPRESGRRAAAAH